MDSVDRRVNALSSLLHAMGNTLTTNLSPEQAWPYITYDGFEVLANNVRRTTGAQCVSLSPLVAGTSEDTLSSWNSYSVTNQAWVEETHEYLSNLEGTEMPEGPFDISPQVFHVTDEGTIIIEDGTELEYAPVWQTFPAPEDALQINYNLLSDDKVHMTFEALGSSKTAESILSPLIDATALYGSAGTQEDHEHDTLQHPQSILLMRLMGDIAMSDGKAQIKNMVGVLSAVLNWDTIFSDIIHDDSPPVYVVVSNLCGDEFTYKIQGTTATYLGPGDSHHVTELEHLVMEGDLSQVGADDGDCVFAYKVYPSQDFEDEYLDSSRPAIWTGVIVGIFVFIAALFLMYDIFIQKRQQKTIDQAERATAMVSSLFPEEVRQRLLAHEDAAKNSHNKRGSAASGKELAIEAGGKYALDQFLRDDHGDMDAKAVKKINPAAEKSMTMYETKPIADLVRILYALYLYASINPSSCRSHKNNVRTLSVPIRDSDVCRHCRVHCMELRP